MAYQKEERQCHSRLSFSVAIRGSMGEENTPDDTVIPLAQMQAYALRGVITTDNKSK